MFTSAEDLKYDIPLESTFYYKIPISLQETFQRVTLEEHIRRFMLKLVGDYLKEFEEALSANSTNERDGLRLTEIYLGLLPYPEECRKNFSKRFPHVAKIFDLALAYVYWQRGEVALADTQFRSCVTLSLSSSQFPNQQSFLPSCGHLCREAARLHYHFGGFDFAREYYEEAEHHNPALQDLTTGEIACLSQDREKGDLEDSASLWRSIVDRTNDENFVFPNLDTDDVPNPSNPMQIRIFERMVDCYARLGRFDELFELLQLADTLVPDAGINFLSTKYYMSYVKALNEEFSLSRDLWNNFSAAPYPFTFLQTHYVSLLSPILNVLWEFNYGHALMGNMNKVPSPPPHGRVSRKDSNLYEFVDNFEFPGRLMLFLDRSGKCVSPHQTLQLQDAIFKQQLYAPFPFVLFDNPCAVCYLIQNSTFCYLFRSLYGTNPPIIEQTDLTEVIYKKIRRGSVRESPPPKKTTKELKEEKKVKRFLKKVMPEAAPSPEIRHKQFQVVESATVGECVVIVGYDFGAGQTFVLAVLHPTIDQLVGYTLGGAGNELFHIRQGRREEEGEIKECCIVTCRVGDDVSKYFIVNSQGNVTTFQDTVIDLFYMDGYVYGVTENRLTQYSTTMEVIKMVEAEGEGEGGEGGLNDPALFQWNRHSDKLGVLCDGLLLVYDSNLEVQLKMEFDAPPEERIHLLSVSETRTLFYVPGKFLLFEGVKLLCSVAEDYCFREGVLAGHVVAKGFVVFGSSSVSDLVTMFYFDDKGKLKGIYPNLIPNIPEDQYELMKWESFVDPEGRIVISEAGGRILCISLE